MTLSGERFDFRRLGSRFVLAPPRDLAALGANPTLRRIGSGAGFLLFEVVDGAPER